PHEVEDKPVPCLHPGRTVAVVIEHGHEGGEDDEQGQPDIELDAAHGDAAVSHGEGAMPTSRVRRVLPSLITPWTTPAGAQTSSPSPAVANSPPTWKRPVPSMT